MTELLTGLKSGEVARCLPAERTGNELAATTPLGHRTAPLGTSAARIRPLYAPVGES